jgi:hypothetical protein
MADRPEDAGDIIRTASEIRKEAGMCPEGIIDESTIEEPVLVTYAQDFESTIQEYIVDQAQLLGVLNFSALWHEVVYLNDIAIGDNPHLIKSFLDPAKSQLYTSVVEFLRAGILRCHLRDKVAIKGSVLVESEPSLTDIFQGWWVDGPKGRFTAQVFGEDRDRYNRVFDEWFKRFPKSVVRYNPDKVKPMFREHVKKALEESGSDLLRLLSRLPNDVQNEYRAVCENNPYFTNADLWRLVRSSNDSEEIIVAHGHINQQCCANLVHSGMTGAERERGLELQQFNWNLHVGKQLDVSIQAPKSFDDALDRADFVLSAPALEILGMLKPNQVLHLRDKAYKTVFKVARDGPNDIGMRELRKEDLANLPTLMEYLQIDKFSRKWLSALRDYWQYVCEFIEKEYPEHARVKTRLGIICYDKIPEIPPQLRVSLIGITLFTGLNWVMPGDSASILWKLLSAAGTTAILDYYRSKLACRVLIERTPAMSELRQLMPSGAWNPRGVFATNRWK